MFERIVLPLDGSELAERALPKAEELARLTGAPILIVRIVDVGKLATHGSLAFGVAPAALQRALDDEERFAREYVEEMARALTERGVAATGEVRYGVADREIVSLTRPNDVIVMATHGRGGMSRWFMGSVAEEVARRSPEPVLLIRSIPAPDERRPDVARVPSGRERGAPPTEMAAPTEM